MVFYEPIHFNLHGGGALSTPGELHTLHNPQPQEFKPQKINQWVEIRQQKSINLSQIRQVKCSHCKWFSNV